MHLAAEDELLEEFVLAHVGGDHFFDLALQEQLAAADKNVAANQAKVDELLGMGYELHRPEGTFYLLPKSPIADDVAFAERLAARNVLVLPGTMGEMPGYFRISITANDEMVARALPGFAEAMRG